MAEERKQHVKKCSICGKHMKWYHGEMPERCIHCNSIRWNLPHDEALLFNLQEEYLLTRNKNVLGTMYTIMFDYAHKIIMKQLPYHFDESKVLDKTEDAVTTIIKYYLTREDYKIQNSFGGSLFGPARQQLFSQRQKDIDNNEISYDNTLDSDNDTTFKDKISSDDLHDDDKYTRELLDISNREYLIKELSKFINNIYTTISSNHGIQDGLLALVLLHHFLTGKKEEFFDEFYTTYGSHLQDLIEKEKLVLLMYIEKLMEK